LTLMLMETFSYLSPKCLDFIDVIYQPFKGQSQSSGDEC